MMHRLICDGCGRAPQYQSDTGIRLCYQCCRVVADYLGGRDLLNQNPFAEELLDGVFHGGSAPKTESEYTVITQSKYASSACSYLLISRPIQ